LPPISIGGKNKSRVASTCHHCGIECYNGGTELPRGGKNKCSVAIICRVMAAKFSNLAKGGNVVARIYHAVAAKI